MSFIDSTEISACHNRRIWSHKVMAVFAARGKTRVDWFYGFKLHLVINDQGYISQLLFDKLLLRKRSIMETVNDQLKNILQIEPSRHRSPFNFFVNLIAYAFREKKPSLNIRPSQALPVVLM
ncbi:Transposase DDE domain-containing protein [Nitrosomonas sp. Nm132]|jgi:hypothetical protein|nr:Transposase DDE domain-containing protein [Nitrosomonas sp. Nm132]